MNLISDRMSEREEMCEFASSLRMPRLIRNKTHGPNANKKSQIRTDNDRVTLAENKHMFQGIDKKEISGMVERRDGKKSSTNSSRTCWSTIAPANEV